MKNISRTIYGSYIQTCMLMGLDPVFDDFTTLNEKFNILPNEVPVAGQPVRMRYFAIGKGGHRVTAGADGTPLVIPQPHLATDAACFSHLPFVLREPGSDLDEVSRRDYALRTTIEHEGNQYIAYWLRRIDMSGVNVAREQRMYDQHGTIVETSPFVPDSSNLNPVPQNLDNTGANTINGQYVTASARIVLSFNRAQIDELLNVARILYGDENYAIISEIALCTAADRIINVTTPGQGSFNFNEAIGVQVMSHINVNYPAAFANEMIEASIDVGAQEPLFKFVPLAP